MEKQLTLIIDKLINEIGQVQVLGDDNKVITDVTADSRVVEKGSLFICLKGATVDGHKFLKMAVE
ncbi:MAG: UDP-N-acetylmuramoyl-L-alanyl-D-glutamate--2,6-diaminopimelate ligase, partial [Phascolarctobacterium sp.]|nr:UDP-N-acetylmuramoyl-L-alanyl-D-glutamate--2,6-diaminopimelate ligase [Phascolarctobacterium sp.]